MRIIMVGQDCAVETDMAAPAYFVNMQQPTRSSSSTGQAPGTALELAVLKAKREELTDQIEEMTERRGRLGQERLNARARGDQAMVQEYDATIGQLGARMTRL